MITCGVDMIEIRRISQKIEKPHFLAKCFTGLEREIFKSKQNPAQTVACHFAGKEAVVKAMGTGFVGVSLLDIEILRDEKGKPYLVFSPKVAPKASLYCWDISFTHTEEMACAMVVALKK